MVVLMTLIIVTSEHPHSGVTVSVLDFEHFVLCLTPGHQHMHARGWQLTLPCASILLIGPEKYYVKLSYSGRHVFLEHEDVPENWNTLSMQGESFHSWLH